MEKILENGVMKNLDCKFLFVGTDDVKLWCDGKPYIIALDTEVMSDLDGYEGTLIIRIA